MAEQRGFTQFGGMDQDMSPKDPKRDIFYFEGNNLTILFNRDRSKNTLSNERGNKLIVSLPRVFLRKSLTKIITNDDNSITTYTAAAVDPLQEITYGAKFDDSFFSTDAAILSQRILGATHIKDRMFVFSTDNATVPLGHLLIWEVYYDTDFTGSVELKYFGPTANMDASKLITKAFGIYETAAIQKLYWVDGGQNQMRTINMSRTDLFNLPVKTIDATPEWNFTTPKVKLDSSLGKGGEWTVGGTGGPGLIQYGYRLYTKHGPVTKMSPLSFQHAITQDFHGVPAGEKGTVIYDLEFTVDTDFEYIEVYRFTHDSAAARNTQCHLIYEGLIESSTFTMTDVGDASNISLIGDPVNLLTTPSGPYYPKTMELKDNRVFIGNLVTRQVDVEYDARAYQFNSSQNCFLTDLEGNPEFTVLGGVPTYPTDLKLDAINEGVYKDPDDAGYSTFKYQGNGTTLGGAGPNVKYNFDSQDLSDTIFKYGNYMHYAGYKRNDLYRFGVQFFDRWGTALFVHWIGDVRIPPLAELESGVMYSSNTFKNIFPEFTLSNLDTLPDNVYALRIVRVPNSPEDRFIKTQAVINSTVFSFSGGGGYDDYRNTYLPHAIIRHFKRNNLAEGGHIIKGYGLPAGSDDLYQTGSPDDNSEYASGTGQYINNSNYLTLHFPEATYGGGVTITDDDNIHSVAGAYIFNGSTGQTYWYKSAESGNEGYKEDTIWTGLFNTNRPVPGATTSWAGLGYAPTAGLERMHWVLRQRVSTVETDPAGGTIFNDILGAVKITNTSNKVELTGNDFRNYHLVAGGITLADDIWLRGRFGTGYLIDVGTAWADDVFTNASTIDNGNIGAQHLILIDVWNDLNTINPFGGKGYINRQKNYYIPCSEIQVISGTFVANVRAYQGDVFPQLFKFLYMDYDEVLNSEGVALNYDPEFFTHGDYNSLTNGMNNPGTAGAAGGSVNDIQSSKTVAEIPMEMYLNLAMMDKAFKFEDHRNAKETRSETPSYNQVYNHDDDYLKAYPVPFTFTEDNEDGLITRYSDVNLPGSYINSHCSFQVANQGSVDSRFGSITAFHIFKETLYVIQEYGIGYWNVSPSAVTNTSTGPTSLGKGDVLYDYVVISEKYGTRYNHASVVGEKGVYVLDMSRKKLVRVTSDDEPVSDLKGTHSLLLTLPKTITEDFYGNGTGIYMGYDPLTYNVYISILYDDGGGLIGGGPSIPASNNPVS